jgi:Fe-S-cluster containining protein
MKEEKIEFLFKIYEYHQEWLSRFPFACSKGCDVCCTNSVNLTRLEGEVVMAVFDNSLTKNKEQNTVELKKSDDEICHPPEKDPRNINFWKNISEETLVDELKPFSLTTTNSHAGDCLGHKINKIDSAGEWDLTPCVFVKNGICSIYELRPFSCRAFVSREKCQVGGAAIISPAFISMNTIVMQVIEHLDIGNSWGPLKSILSEIINGTKPGLPKSVALPGFVISDQEKKQLNKFLAGLFSLRVNQKSLEEIPGLDQYS